VVLGADAVHAEEFAGHLEAGDLVAAVLEQDVGLEEAGTDRIDRLEGIAGAVQVLAALEACGRRRSGCRVAPCRSVVEAERQAQLAQVALRAGDLESWRDHRDYVLLDICMHGCLGVLPR
jgi:hypothetical protein